jgi:hypothetical protein
LDVYKSGSNFLYTMRNDVTEASFYVDNVSAQWGTTTNDKIILFVNNTNAMGISNAGGVGIGNNSFNGYTNTISSGTLIVQTGVGIGTPTPNAALAVSGAAINAGSILNAGTTIDFIAGNLQYTNGNCGSFNLWDLKDGGSYTFAVKGTTSAACTFNAFSDAGSTQYTVAHVHLPPDLNATTSGKQTLFTFTVIGGDVYVGWNPGL